MAKKIAPKINAVGGVDVAAAYFGGRGQPECKRGARRQSSISCTCVPLSCGDRPRYALAKSLWEKASLILVLSRLYEEPARGRHQRRLGTERVLSVQSLFFLVIFLGYCVLCVFSDVRRDVAAVFHFLLLLNIYVLRTYM